MYSAEALFLRDINNLKRYVEAPTEDNLLHAAAILRRLLLDEYPLIDNANKNVRCKVRYNIQTDESIALRNRTMPKPSFSARFDGIVPRDGSTDARAVTRKQFLAQILLTVEGHEYTTRDIILYVCNQAGAVHKSDPKTPAGRYIESVGRGFRVGGPAGMVSPALRPILPISVIVIAACEELYAKLAEVLGASRRVSPEQKVQGKKS